MGWEDGKTGEGVVAGLGCWKRGAEVSQSAPSRGSGSDDERRGCEP